jgi:hypothetical protein
MTGRTYSTDLRHFLDDKGAIVQGNGPGSEMAEFLAHVVSHTTGSRQSAAPECFKCRKHEVKVVIGEDGYIRWSCGACKTNGSIGNWRGTLWDLSNAHESSRM